MDPLIVGIDRADARNYSRTSANSPCSNSPYAAAQGGLICHPVFPLRENRPTMRSILEMLHHSAATETGKIQLIGTKGPPIDGEVGESGLAQRRNVCFWGGGSIG